MFTARYGLSPYITWIRLVLRGFKNAPWMWHRLGVSCLNRHPLPREDSLPRTARGYLHINFGVVFKLRLPQTRLLRLSTPTPVTKIALTSMRTTCLAHFIVLEKDPRNILRRVHTAPLKIRRNMADVRARMQQFIGYPKARQTDASCAARCVYMRQRLILKLA